METVFFQGSPVHTCGNVPAVGTKAPAFTLVSKDLAPVRLSDYEGKRVVLNVFPSLDTPVCAASVRRFNQEAAGLENTVVLCISEDLPFAMSRFCAAEGIDNVVAASAFQDPMFAEKYGLQIADGPLKGLLARAVLIVDEKGEIVYCDLVDEITREPNYDGAIDVLKNVY